MAYRVQEEKGMFFSERFITASKEYCTFDRHVNAPLFQREFKLQSFVCVELTICGLGFYEIILNGKNITKGKLAPYISNPDEVLCYDHYTVTDHVNRGLNTLVVLLGNGMLNAIGGGTWAFDQAGFRSAPKLALALEADGRLVFEADECFTCSPSPILFDDLRAGEWYDARQELKADVIRMPVFTAQKPKGAPCLVQCENICVVKEIEPVQIVRQEDGYLYDFGVNTAGICRLCLTDTKRGQKITLLHGEMLKEGKLYTDNILCDEHCRKDYFHKDVYICKGAEKEIYEPHFTYHGFRYVFAQGLRETQALKSSLTLLEMHSDLRRAGNFCCSDQALNTLQQNVCRSTASNFYYFPTDCPQREKNGWTGDAALSAEQTLLNYQAANSLREWLFHIRKAQKADGQLPGVIPTAGWGYEWGSGPAWDAALIYLPYYIYKYGGDIEILDENAEAIARYLQYLSKKRNADGLLAFGLGDWCQPKRLSHLYETPLEVTDSLVAYNLCQKAKQIFSVLGFSQNETFADELAFSIRETYRRKYISRGRVVTQTELALALAYGIYEPSERESAVLRLLDKIHADGDCFATGILGARELFRVLSEYGHADVAYRLAMQDKFPSYYYHIKNGATTLFEDFHEFEEGTYFRKDGRLTNSLNHHFWGDISAWMYIYIVGIRVNPNFTEQDTIVFQPEILQSLTFAAGEYEHRRGKVCLRWHKTADGAEIEIMIPAGIQAEFVTPCGYRTAQKVRLIEGKNNLFLYQI